ncbi:biopolymer transport membrane protein, TolR-related protein [Syntrophotalea carbinolica DSM 2380]|uniref:Biopolymer transport membrane protein, TolR-related protein n=1 Tax=Syntrophotalea carbinolica (strain DSM 2380 / NBRC 103641 / GraBd1) TaxID=338963 RepID=Q3A4F5_SYNC1|nr:biopolymer transporter ExbD [Syntrophotalea carbinolica]ABA88752.1 biopolymer transport membrane protein, TolR-related protein [Syntrophotalea carbinolica DSM 2380]
MAFLRKKREAPRVDLTSMVDVVFLLLIFFMISTTFVEAPGIDVKLPESSSQVSESEVREVKVYLSQDGEISLGKEKVSQQELERRLRAYRSEAGAMTFVLLADKNALHGQVVRLMDLAKVNGFGKLAIATEYAKNP